MSANLIDSLIVTAVGMSITFVAIVLLWWMMAGLTVVDDRWKTALSTKEASPAQADEVDEHELRAKAAAAAVAVALAEQELSSARPLDTPPSALVSAWQLGTRSRQLYEKGKRR